MVVFFGSKNSRLFPEVYVNYSKISGIIRIPDILDALLADLPIKGNKRIEN